MFLCLQCTVQVKLELGHRAQLRKKVTSEGFTHDWMVFVRGPENSDIQHFVDKVVFRLHESFPKPKRGKFDNFTNEILHHSQFNLQKPACVRATQHVAYHKEQYAGCISIKVLALYHTRF